MMTISRRLRAAQGSGNTDASAIERLLDHPVRNADLLEELLNEQALVAAVVTIRYDQAERR
jgi:hypothetical protein